MKMATQSAIIVEEPGRAVLRQDAPIPELPENYILVKTKAGMLPYRSLSLVLTSCADQLTKLLFSRLEPHGLAAH